MFTSWQPLHYRLKHLVTRKRLVMDGEGRWARYRMPDTAIDAVAREDVDKAMLPLSEAATAIRDYVRQAPPVTAQGRLHLGR